MPIDLNSSIKGASQWAFGSPLLNNILGSSIFVACVIALLMVILIMFMYPAKPGTSFSVLAKLFVYMFFSTMLVIFLHDGVIKYMLEEESSEKDNAHFMQNTTMIGRVADPAYAGLYKTVSPMPNAADAITAAPPTVISPAVTPSTVITPSDTISGGGHLTSIKPMNKSMRNMYA